MAEEYTTAVSSAKTQPERAKGPRERLLSGARAQRGPQPPHHVISPYITRPLLLLLLLLPLSLCQ